MTFLQIQDRVMGRLNLSSTVARTRIKGFINERVRAAQTSTNLGRVRRGSETLNTVAAQATLETITIIKPVTISLPAYNWVLRERTEDQLRNYDPAGQWTGVPEMYAVQKITADSVVLEFKPIPDAIYVIRIDGMLAGSELTADGDIPAIPEDFHDMFVYGAACDELMHLEKFDQASAMEGKWVERLKACRYFVSKSIYLHRAQNDNNVGNWEWWFYGSPWAT